MKTIKYSQEAVANLMGYMDFRGLIVKNIRKNYMWGLDVHNENGALLISIHGKTFNDLHDNALTYAIGYTQASSQFRNKLLFAEAEIKRLQERLAIAEAAAEGVEQREKRRM